MLNVTEDHVRKEVKKHLMKCRPGDWNHTLRVVRWTKEFGDGRSDLLTITTASYIHDIGWEGLISKDKMTFDELLQLEEQADQNSEKNATSFLRSLGIAQENINTINRLIRAADLHISSRDDEEIIVDADNISKLTINHVLEKFEQKEWMKVHDMWKKEFPQRIKTQKAKGIYPSLLANLRIAIQKELENKN